MFPVRLRSAIPTLALIFTAVLLTSFAPSSARAQAKDAKLPTAEQVAELVIIYFGQRPVLQQVRRTGIERGAITRTKEDGGKEEISYERRFMRGDSSDKDKVRVDQKTPAAEFSLLFNEGRLSGIINGVSFTPREDVQNEFLDLAHHDIDTLLRYKENKSEVTLVGREKQKNIDMYILELVDKDQRRTRYYVSAQRARVLWLEYEEPGAPGTTPAKIKRTYHDYSYAQGTLVPYRIVTYVDGKQRDEKRIRTVTYGVKMDEAFFRNTETTAATTP